MMEVNPCACCNTTLIFEMDCDHLEILCELCEKESVRAKIISLYEQVSETFYASEADMGLICRWLHIWATLGIRRLPPWVPLLVHRQPQYQEACYQHFHDVICPGWRANGWCDFQRLIDVNKLP